MFWADIVANTDALSQIRPGWLEEQKGCDWPEGERRGAPAEVGTRLVACREGPVPKHFGKPRQVFKLSQRVT